MEVATFRRLSLSQSFANTFIKFIMIDDPGFVVKLLMLTECKGWKECIIDSGAMDGEQLVVDTDGVKRGVRNDVKNVI